MSEFTVDISLGNAFFNAFGYRNEAYDITAKPIAGIVPGSRNENGDYGSPYYAKGGNDREVFLPIKVSLPGDEVVLPTGDKAAGKFTSWLLPYAVISVSARKTIIETAMTERRGTIKEFINTEDYTLTVRGLLIAAGNEFPEADVKLLRDLFVSNNVLLLSCAKTDPFLAACGKRVVVKSFDMPEVRGNKRVHPYTIEFVSDMPFNLTDIN